MHTISLPSSEPFNITKTIERYNSHYPDAFMKIMGHYTVNNTDITEECHNNDHLKTCGLETKLRILRMHN